MLTVLVGVERQNKFLYGVVAIMLGQVAVTFTLWLVVEHYHGTATAGEVGRAVAASLADNVSPIPKPR